MRKLVNLLLGLIISFSIYVPVHADQQPLLQNEKITLHSKYAYAYDATSGQALYKKRSSEKMYPASMTKAITAYIALKKIVNLDEKVTISDYDVKGWGAYGASLADITAGEVMTYRDLIYGALFPSGADACRALAMNTYGSEIAFVEAMNAMVTSLGLKNTSFRNNHGLNDNQHYTTCEDMVALFDQCMENKDFVAILTGKSVYKTSDGKHTWTSSVETVKRRHKIRAPLVAGAKSGFTNPAGRCLISVSYINKHKIYICTGKAPKAGYNVKDHDTLTRCIKAKMAEITLYQAHTQLDQCWLLLGKSLKYDVTYDQSIRFYTLSSEAETYHVSYFGKKVLIAPVPKGELIGTLTITKNGQIIDEIPVKLTETLPVDYTYCAIELGIPLIVLIVIIRLIRKLRKKRYQGDVMMSDDSQVSNDADAIFEDTVDRENVKEMTETSSQEVTEEHESETEQIETQA